MEPEVKDINAPVSEAEAAEILAQWDEPGDEAEDPAADATDADTEITDADPTADDEDEALEGASLEDDEAEDGDDEDAQDDEDDPASTIDMPDSWGQNEEDAEAWAELSPQIQERIVAREADRDKSTSTAVSEAGQQRSMAIKAAERLASMADAAQTALDHISSTYVQYGYDEMQPADWADLARKDPTAYAKHKAHAEQLQADFQSAQTARQEAMIAQQQKEAGRQAELLEQHAPEVHKERANVAKYMGETYGLKPEQLSTMTAIDYVNGWKAMQWDKAQADAKKRAASKKPAKPAPKRGKASSAQGSSPSKRRSAKAAKTFMSGSRSEDAALAAFTDDML